MGKEVLVIEMVAVVPTGPNEGTKLVLQAPPAQLPAAETCNGIDIDAPKSSKKIAIITFFMIKIYSSFGCSLSN
jgi:hypothetical protein